MPKFIIYVEGEALEVFDGTEDEANSRAYEAWLEAADQDYYAKPYTRKEAQEAGLEEDE